MTDDAAKSQGDSEVFRFGGFGTVLLVALLAFIAMYPLMLGNTIARLAGGFILAVILVAGSVTASHSHIFRLIGVALAIVTLVLQVEWMITHSRQLEVGYMAVLAVFLLYTALVIFRHVLSYGPLYADRVHAALSVYILLALSWASIYTMVEILLPGSFSLSASMAGAQTQPSGLILLGDMIHLSIATLTSTGFGDITPVTPFARSINQLEQLLGVFYIAVLISRLVGIYPSSDRV
jgi:hypothetical protein